MKRDYPISDEGLRLTDNLLLLFVGLKLTGYIDWYWVFVVSPIWISWFIIAPIFDWIRRYGQD